MLHLYEEITIKIEFESEDEETENTNGAILYHKEYCRLITTAEPVHIPIQKSVGGSYFVYEAKSSD